MAPKHYVEQDYYWSTSFLISKFNQWRSFTALGHAQRRFALRIFENWLAVMSSPTHIVSSPH